MDKDLGLEDVRHENGDLTLEAARDAADKRAIRLAITRSRRNLTQAARILGVTRGTLYRLMDKYDISAEAASQDEKHNALPLCTG